MNGLYRRKARLHQQLQSPLVAIAAQHTAESGRIAARQQESAGFDKSPLELHLFIELRGIQGIVLLGYGAAPAQITRPSLGSEGFFGSGLFEHRRSVRHRGFKNSQRGCDGNVMRNQVTDHLLNRRAVDIEPLCEVLFGFACGADVRFLSRIEFGIDHDAVFQIVDAQRRGFPKTNGA